MATDASLDGTLRAFQDGITNLSTDGAIALLGAWTDRINQTGRADLEGIAELLQQIAGLLQSPPHHGTEIGALLKRAGAHTAEVASTASSEAEAEKLRQLGGLCKAAGTALSGGGQPRQGAPYASRDEDPAADDLQSINKADRLAGQG